MTKGSFDSRVDAALIKRDIYNRVLGLYNPKSEADKAFGVILHKEKLAINRPVDVLDMMNEFIEAEIYANYGLNLIEFMELDIQSSTILVEHARRTAKQKAEATANALKGIG